MYDIIYDFIHDNLLTSLDLSTYSMSVMGVNTSFDVWLSHTLSIISIVLLFIVAVLFTKWIFKLASGLLTRL